MLISVAYLDVYEKLFPILYQFQVHSPSICNLEEWFCVYINDFSSLFSVLVDKSIWK